MEVKGKIIQVGSMQTGEGKNGPWKKQQVIVETDDRYPKKICLDFWTNVIDEISFDIDKVISVEVELSSREFNGKWYSDIRVWRVNKGDHSSAASTQKTNSNAGHAFQNGAPEYTASDEMSTASDYKDDLPF